MNARTLRLLQEMLLAVALCIVLRVVLSALPQPVNLMALHLLPLVWIGLRHGGPASIVTGAISGFVLTFLQWQGDFVTSVLTNVTPLLVVGISGFFAKYTQKTLNNRRLSSTYLNISTASLLVSLSYVALNSLVRQDGMILSMQTLLAVILTTVLLSGILCLMAKLNDKLLIPKRTKYLSRKETTSLLN